MGNNNNTPSVQTPIDEFNSSTNGSAGGIQGLFGIPDAAHHGSFWSLFFALAAYTKILDQCHVQTHAMVFVGVKIFILVTSFPANVGLLWMLLHGGRVLTPSEVLGLNVAIMDVLYCLCLPLDIYISLHETPETTSSVQEALFALSVFGCPLLLTFMCLERYVAAAWPVLYIRFRRQEYRLVLCACAWILTLAVGLLGYFVGLLSMTLPLSITISLLFLVMLLCLLGITWVLCQRGPSEGPGSSVPLKKRALKNIVAVMVPSAVAYSPLVALVPYMAVVASDSTDAINPAQCYILQVLLLFPNFGLFIGPMFYLSRLRRTARRAPESKTQAE